MLDIQSYNMFNTNVMANPFMLSVPLPTYTIPPIFNLSTVTNTDTTGIFSFLHEKQEIYTPSKIAYGQTSYQPHVTNQNYSTKYTPSKTILPKCASKIKPGLLKGNLKGKEGIITALCQKYGIKDIGLVVSIICLESGYGTSNLARHNNFMGYRSAGDCGKNKKGFGYFSTPEKGLETAIRNLAHYTRFSDVKSIDISNIDTIGRHYCEGNKYPDKIRNMYVTVEKYLI